MVATGRISQPSASQKDHRRRAGKETPSQGDKITLLSGHVVRDLLKEGFIGGRLERCSEKHFLLISISFNYFDSSKKKGEKSRWNSCRGK